MSLAYSYALAAVVAASGCSLVYDADDLRAGRDGGGGPSADADPDALFVARVTPDAVFEGEGSSFLEEQQEMVRPIPIVLEGQNMTAETVFTISGLGLDMEIEDVAVSGDGHFAAFELRVPIDPALTDGDQSEDLAIRLAKGDEEANAPLVDVTGLDALEVPEGGTLDTDALHSRYTHVDLAEEVVATGTAPLRVIATAGIRITGTLRADAGDAPDAGPGGCPGGGPTNSADCGAGSGKFGENTGSPGGGGGGGYGTDGDAGTGGAGEGGDMAGQRFVAPLPPADGADAHGAGGGGGGALTLDASGAGGGSGGVVELSTAAILSLSATAVVSAAGGNGDPPPTSCATGGGGGGGSGGAILLRAATVVAQAGATATALGGNGAGGGTCVGGSGGKGRIRIDRGNDAAIDADPAAFVGPMPIIDDLLVIVDTASFSLPVRGEAHTNYEVYANDQEPPATFETDGNGLGAADVTLEPGLNTLCVYVADKTDFDLPEAKNCVNVAYIKP
jgi:hypothetical protein